MWETPVPQLVLAIEGKVDFVKKTNPFGSGDDKEDNKKGKPKKKQGSDQNILEVFKKFSEANKKDNHKPYSVEKQQ